MVTVFSPAKINLFLAITGRRADGYHDLVSVAAPLDFGDELAAEIRESTVPACWPAGVCPGQPPGKGAESRFRLTCDHPEVPVDGSNLVLKAAQAFAAATGWEGSVDFKLTKRIPLGAGLGGGSSNAVAALRALNQLTGGLLPEAKLTEVAATLGSDCALFLKNTPVIMRGRGERVEVLGEAAAQRLRGRRVLIFKPSFGVSTASAYGRMATQGSWQYLSAEQAEARLAVWLRRGAPRGEPLFNNMKVVVFAKYLALPVLLEKLRTKFGVAAGMSGSGSACFALLDDPPPGSTDAPPGGAVQSYPPEAVTEMKQMIGECWGPTVFVKEACIT